MDIQFWYHTYFKWTSINSLISSYSEYNCLEFNEDLVDTNKINIIPFFWENGAQIGLDSIVDTPEFIEILTKLNNLGFYLLGDFSTEVLFNTDETSSDLLDRIISKHFDLNRFFLVQNNGSLNGYEVIKYGNHQIKTIHIPHFIINTSDEMSVEFPNLKINKDRITTKDFLCLNRRMRYDKFLFLKELWKNKLLDKTHYTFVSNYVPKEIFDNDSFAKELGLSYDNFNPIQLSDDVYYGQELDYKDEYLNSINPKWYYDSKVNIVVETWPGKKPIHITEKTIKPMYLGIPFTVYASSGFLDKLKEFGFKTFETVIGSYDCTSPKEVIDASKRLAKVYNTDEVLDIVTHNYNHIRNKTVLSNLLETSFLDILKTSLNKKPIKFI